MSKSVKVSRKVVIQGFKQLLGIVYIYISHCFSLKNKNTYQCKVRYQLPFEGEWTVINGGTEKEFSHSWMLPTQRYAYDFLIMNHNGETYYGDKTEEESYYCYGRNILSPADGKIVDIGSNCIDNKPFADGVLAFTAEDIRGNYIIIKHAEKEYSFIGHIKPESIQVEVGQNVQAGEVIAKCGNSGNTSEPHIHFHLQDGTDFFLSAGLPITFENIHVTKQENYHIYDERKTLGEIVISAGGQYIGRGQLVSNASSQSEYNL